jgi:hypothetical protein
MNQPKYQASDQIGDRTKENKPKYQIGDRFTVMQTVQFEIVDVVLGKEISYIFQLFDNPVFQSIVTEHNLDDILVAQKTA